MKPAIRVENLSKSYRLGSRTAGSYQTLRETINDSVAGAWHGLRRRLGGASNGTSNGQAKDNAFWALKDVSFEVQRGEVVGIIGRNGAGKSTLLKILSRIVEPTGGRCEVHGRIASLLEVGTGFHPELTGRENIYMNGSILGMSRKEIDSKFDEIVAFSETEQFLDTPVKRYSSGMYVRLAFAVAAHLDPEVLIVDEVLSVGDTAFQRKCLEKIGEVTRCGRCVLFVSHNMAAVQSLCDRVIVVRRGEIVYTGRAEDGIRRYLNESATKATAETDLREHPARRSGCLPILQAVRFLDRNGNLKETFQPGESIRIEFTVEPVVPLNDPQFGIGVDDGMKVRLFSLTTYLSSGQLPAITKRCKVSCSIDTLCLVPGQYLLSLSAGSSLDMLDALDHVVALEIESGDFYGNGMAPSASLGSFWVRSHWCKG